MKYAEMSRKSPHEVRLIRRAKPAAQADRHDVLPALCVVPGAGAGIRDHQVVKDDEDGEKDAQVVDEEQPRAGRSPQARRRVRASRRGRLHGGCPPDAEKRDARRIRCHRSSR